MCPTCRPNPGRSWRASIGRGAANGAAVVSVHGGRWVSQDRLTNAVIDRALAAAGVVVMALDFRMPPVVRYPVPVSEINVAIRWLKQHAAEFGAAPALVGGIGTSSGGHQIMLNALRPRDPRYSAIKLPGGEKLDASLAYVVACWPVLDPLARYRMAKERKMDLHVQSHDAYWPDEAAMGEGNPQLILDRGEAVRLPPCATDPRYRRHDRAAGDDGPLPRHLPRLRRRSHARNIRRASRTPSSPTHRTSRSRARPSRRSCNSCWRKPGKRAPKLSSDSRTLAVSLRTGFPLRLGPHWIEGSGHGHTDRHGGAERHVSQPGPRAQGGPRATALARTGHGAGVGLRQRSRTPTGCMRAIEFGFMASNWIGRAKNGEPPFAQPIDIRMAAPMNAGPLFFIARAGSPIRTVADLRGRRVVLGMKTSGMVQHAHTSSACSGLPSRISRRSISISSPARKRSWRRGRRAVPVPDPQQGDDRAVRARRRSGCCPMPPGIWTRR